MKKIIFSMLSCFFLITVIYNSNLKKNDNENLLSLKNIITMTEAFTEVPPQYCPSSYTVTYSGTPDNIYVVCTPGGSYKCPLCGIA
jgi:hypothetical protein